MKQGFVYILASGKHGTLYTGVTADLQRRVHQHKNDLVQGFTKQYHVYRLVYYESFKNITDAIAREKCIKRWKRSWKITLIEADNPDWQDLCK